MSINEVIIHIVFYVFAISVVLSGVMVITSRNTVRSVLFLVLTFVGAAGLWMLLEAEFLSLILVLVYVGAVMTLFLFVVMMLNADEAAEVKRHWKKYMPFAVVIILMLILMLLLVVGPEHFGLAHYTQPALVDNQYSNTASLGTMLYVHDVIPFEVAGVLLLVAMIAAISLTHRPPQNRKSQNISDQLLVKPKDRIRIVKMKSSNEEDRS